MRFIQGETLEEAIKSFHRDVSKLEGAAGHFDCARFWAVFWRFAMPWRMRIRRGILHRDIKPSNIMLGPFGQTMIIDWGLSKATGRSDRSSLPDPLTATLVPTRVEVTTRRAWGGSWARRGMSPEAAAGKLDQITQAADVYGLGATLYASADRSSARRWQGPRGNP